MAVALDEPEAARPWVEDAGVTFTTLADPNHLVAELYGLYNVPSVVWIDEDDRIVRPPDMAFGDNTFQEFTGVDAEVHHEELRAWVRDDRIAYSTDFVRENRLVPSPNQQEARNERRLGAWLVRNGHQTAARRHLERAVELAPMDWTVRRGSMPMRGSDPFGDEFFAFLGDWTKAGQPGYGWGTSDVRFEG